MSINAARKRIRKRRKPTPAQLDHAADAAELERLIGDCSLTPKNANSARIILEWCGYNRAAEFVERNARK